MCEKCDILSDKKIQTPEELFLIVEQCKSLVREGAMMEVEKTDGGIVEQTRLSDIEKDKPWSRDVLLVLLGCLKCGRKFEISCEVYHGFGGSIRVIEDIPWERCPDGYE